MPGRDTSTRHADWSAHGAIRLTRPCRTQATEPAEEMVGCRADPGMVQQRRRLPVSSRPTATASRPGSGDLHPSRRWTRSVATRSRPESARLAHSDERISSALVATGITGLIAGRTPRGGGSSLTRLNPAGCRPAGRGVPSLPFARRQFRMDPLVDGQRHLQSPAFHDPAVGVRPPDEDALWFEHGPRRSRSRAVVMLGTCRHVLDGNDRHARRKAYSIGPEPVLHAVLVWPVTVIDFRRPLSSHTLGTLLTRGGRWTTVIDLRVEGGRRSASRTRCATPSSAAA